MSNPHVTTTIISQAGETLDCALFRARRSDDRDAVLAANRHLTQLSAVLPEFTPITLPVVVATAAAKRIDTLNLWD